MNLKISSSFVLGIAASLFVGLFLVSLIAFIVFAIVYFPQRESGTRLQDLGLYGDFFGGMLGTIVAFGSLGVTIYLARVLHRLEKENANSAIQAQRSIAKMQMKHQEFSIFRTNCDNGFDLISSPSNRLEKVSDGCNLITNAIQRLISIFPDLATPEMNFMSISYPVRVLHDIRSELPSERIPGYSVSIDEVAEKVHMMYEQFQAANNSYYEVIRKLSVWVFK